MAVALDAVTPSAACQKNDSNSGALGTWSHTVTGSNTLLLVAVGVGTPAGSSDTNTVTVAFGAAPVPSISAQVHSNGGTNGFIQLFALAGASGTATITVTVTGTYHKDILAAALSFTGVDQTTPLGSPSTNTGSGTTASPTAAIASATNNMLFAFEGNGSSAATTCNNATERFDGSQGNTSTACTCIAGSTAPGAATVNPTFTIGDDWWSYIGVDIKAAASSSAITFTDSGGIASEKLTGGNTPIAFSDAGNSATTLTIGNKQLLLPETGTTADVLTKSTGQRFISQILGSGQLQYWADAAGQPILLQGDTIWSLLFNAGNSGGSYTWQYDLSHAMSTRGGQGYNAIQISALGNIATLHGAYADGRTFDGVAPFVGGDIGVLNDTYWTRLDYLLDQAETYGITLFINLMMTGDSYFLPRYSAAQMTTYGTAIGNRYKTRPNIQWMVGDDVDNNWDTSWSGILTGLRNAGDTHYISIENIEEGTSRYRVADNYQYNWGIAHGQFNWVYTRGTQYDAIEYAYSEASPLLVMRGDGTYGYADDGTGTGKDARSTWRNRFWWVFSSGGRGYMHGYESVWPWYAGPSPYPTDRISANPVDTDFNNACTAFKNLTGWHQLLPDTNSSFVTAGRGTHATHWVFPPATNYGDGTLNTYVTASITPDGKLAVVYIPSNAASITINPVELASPYTVSWVDPANGTKTSTSIAGTYRNTNNNSAGGTDWVLVFEAAATPKNLTDSGAATTVLQAAVRKTLIVSAAATDAIVTYLQGNYGYGYLVGGYTKWTSPSPGPLPDSGTASDTLTLTVAAKILADNGIADDILVQQLAGKYGYGYLAGGYTHPAGDATPTITDATTAAETLAVGVGNTDNATANDQANTSSAITAAGTNTATDRVTVNAQQPAADTGTATDTIAFALSGQDTAAASDNLTTIGALTPVNTGTATETINVLQGTIKVAADNATAVDAINKVLADSYLTLSDNSIGDDTLTATTQTFVNDYGTATTVISVPVRTLQLPDNANATDNITRQRTDAGTASDKLVATANVPLRDTGTAIAILTGSNRAISFTDAATATSAINVARPAILIVKNATHLQMLNLSGRLNVPITVGGLGVTVINNGNLTLPNQTGRVVVDYY